MVTHLGAGIGAGHNIAAGVLKSCFQAAPEVDELQKLDILESTNQIYRTLYDDGYFALVEAVPWLVGWGYDTIATGPNPDLGAEVGWPGYVDQVGEVVASIPAAQRADTIVLAQSYQQAAALDVLRPANGVTMPAVYSGHNGFWFWGPPRESATDAIIIGNFSPAELATGYAHCKVAGTVQTPPGVDNDLTGTPIHRCTGLRQPWSLLWPQAATFA